MHEPSNSMHIGVSDKAIFGEEPKVGKPRWDNRLKYMQRLFKTFASGFLSLLLINYALYQRRKGPGQHRRSDRLQVLLISPHPFNILFNASYTSTNPLWTFITDLCVEKPNRPTIISSCSIPSLFLATDFICPQALR